MKKEQILKNTCHLTKYIKKNFKAMICTTKLKAS